MDVGVEASIIASHRSDVPAGRVAACCLDGFLESRSHPIGRIVRHVGRHLGLPRLLHLTVAVEKVKRDENGLAGGQENTWLNGAIITTKKTVMVIFFHRNLPLCGCSPALLGCVEKSNLRRISWLKKFRHNGAISTNDEEH